MRPPVSRFARRKYSWVVNIRRACPVGTGRLATTHRPERQFFHYTRRRRRQTAIDGGVCETRFR